MPKNNNDIVVNLKLGTKGFLNELGQLEDIINTALEKSVDIGVDRGSKKELEDLQKTIEGLKSDIDRIDKGKIGQTKFKNFEEQTNKKIDAIKAKVDGLQDVLAATIVQMGELGTNIDLSKPMAEFDKFTQSIEACSTAIDSIVKNKQIKGDALVSIKDIDSIKVAVDGLDKALNETKSLKERAAWGEIYKDLADDKALSTMKGLVTEYLNLNNAVKEAQKAFDNAPKDNNIFETANLEKAKLEFEQVAIRINALKEELQIQTGDNKAWEKMAGIISHAVQMAEAAEDEFQDTQKTVSKILSEAQTVYNNYDETFAKSTEQFEKINETYGNVQKLSDLLKDNAIYIEVKTNDDDIAKISEKLKDTVDKIQAELNRKSLEVPIKIVITSAPKGAESGTEEGIKTAQSVIEEARKSGDSVYVDMSKTIGKSFGAALTNATSMANRAFGEIRRTVEAIFKKPIPVEFEPDKTSLEEVKTEIANTVKGGNLNIADDLKEASVAANVLKEALSEVLGLASEVKAKTQVKTNYSGKETKASLEQKIQQYKNDMEAILSRVQTDIVDKSPVYLKLDINPSEFSDVKKKIEDNLVKEENLDITSSLQKADSIAQQIAKTLGVLNGFQATITGATSEVDLTKVNEQLEAATTQLQVIVVYLNSIQELIKGLQTESPAAALKQDTKELSVDFSAIVDKIDELMGVTKALIEDLRLDFSVAESSVKELGTTLSSVISEASNNNLDTKWLNIANAFREVAGEADNIDLRKQKNQIIELLSQYQEYVSLGGRYSFDMLTNNQKTLEKLQRVSNQSFNALPVSSNKSVEEVYDSFDKILTSLGSIDGKLIELVDKLRGVQLTPDQIEGFKQLDEILQRIVTSLNTINGNSKNKKQINVKKEDAETFDSLSKSLTEINTLTDVGKVFENIKLSKTNVNNIAALADVLPNVVKGLQDLEKVDSFGFLNQLSELANASAGLDKLATVLSASKEKIEEAISPKLGSDFNIQSVKFEFEDLNKTITKLQERFKRRIPNGFEELVETIYKLEVELLELSNIPFGEATNAEREKFSDLKFQLQAAKEELIAFDNIAKETSVAKMFLRITQFEQKALNLTDAEVDALEQLKARLNDVNLTRAGLEEIAADFSTIESNAIAAGHTVGNFFDAVKNKLKYKWAETFAMFFSFYDIIRYIRELSSTVIELNDNLIELSKVSDTSISELIDQFNDFKNIAVETGNSIKGVISATADWARMGYSLPDSKKLAEVAQIYKNVGDNISIDEANEYLISTLQGFQKTADEALHIVDIYNEVANNFAIDTQGIGEAMERSAASFYAANTSLEESVALVTAANTVLQAPDVVGTTFKTLSARIRGATSELEELGEETVVTTSKLRGMIKALTGFDIMNSETEFKSIYEILVGIGKEWDNLTDIERASLGEMLAGKRNANALYAVLQNIDTLEAAYETAQESAGSAMREQEHYMEGISYSVEQFKATLEDISNDLLDSDFAKSVVDFGTKVLEFLDKIIEHPTIALLLGGGLGLRKLSSNGNGGFIGLYGAIHDVTQAYKEYIAAIIQAEQVESVHTATTKVETESAKENALANQSEALSEMQQAQADIAHTAAMKENIAMSKVETATDLTTASANVAEATSQMAQKLKDSFTSLLAMPGKILKGFVALAKAIPMLGIGTAIVGIGLAVYKVYKDVQEGEEQLKKSAKEVSSEYSNATKDISSYKKEIEELQDIIKSHNSSYAETSNARERLLAIQDELIEKYGVERESIDNITDAINGQVNALDKLSDKQWRAAKRKFEENNLPGIDWITHLVHGTNSDLGVMFDEMENASAYLNFNGLTNLNDRELAKQIQSIFGGTLKTNAMSSTGVAKISGSLDDVYNKLLLIQKKANEIGASDYALDSIEKAINEIEETMDSYSEFYNQYILQERIVGTGFEDNYQSYITAFQKYQEAIVSGSEEKTQEALDKIANEYSNLVQELLDDETLSDTERQSILSFFEGLYPQLSSMISQWKFSANVDFSVKTEDLISGKTKDKTQEQIVNEVLDNFKTREDLLHYNEKSATDEQKQAYSDLNALLAQRNATEEDFINFMVQEGHYVQAIEEEIRNIPNFEINFNRDTIKNATDGIKELQSTYQSLYDKMSDGKEGIDLAFTISDIDSLKEKLVDADGQFAVSQDVWNNFFDIMTDGSHSFDEMETALNQVLSDYVNTAIALEDFDKEQADAISTQLQLAGVTKESAEAYVSGMTDAANAIQDASDRSYDFVNATWSEIDAEFKLADQSKITAAEIIAYTLEKKAASGFTIQTSSDVDNLLTLANAAGITAKSLIRYAEIKADLDAAIKKGDTDKIRWVRQTLDTYVKDMDAAALAAEVRVSAASDKLEQDRDKAASNHKSSSSKAAKQEEDLWKKAYEKELADLDHLHEMELISDIQYYNERNRLNEKYFANNEKYAEDYAKNQEDIYKGLKSAYKTYLDECLDSYQKALDSGLLKLEAYSAQAKGLIEQLYSNGLIDDETYHTKMADYYGAIISQYDKAINAAQRAIKKEISNLEKQKDALNDDYDKRKAAVQAQIDDLQKLVDARNDEIEAINDVIDDKNKQIKAINKEIKAKNKQIDAVNKEIKAKNKEIDELNAQVKVKNKEIDNINKEVKAKNKIIDGINKEIKARNKIIDGYQKQIEVIQDEIDVYQDEIDKLNEANKERQAALEYQKALYNLERAENQRTKMVYNSEKGFVYESNAEDIKAAQEELENLKHEQAVAVLEKQISVLEDSIEVLNDKIEEVQDEIEELNNQIEELQDEIEILNERIEKLQDEIEILNEHIEDIQDEIDNLNKIIEEWQEEIDVLDEKIEALEEEIEVLDEHIEALEEIIDGIDKQIEAFEDEINNLETELDGLTAKIDEEIEKFEEYSEAWGEVANKFTESQEDMVAAQLWGSNYKEQILNRDMDLLNTFTNDYIAKQKAQVDMTTAAANDIVAQYQRQIDALNKWKEAQASAQTTSSEVAAAPASQSTQVKNTIATTTSTYTPYVNPATGNAVNPVKYNAPQQKAQRSTQQKQNTSIKGSVKQYTYGIGTKSAAAGVQEVAETGNEIIRDNYGNAYLAEGHQLHRFEGGERVYSPTETQELLRGKYVPIDSILPNYSDMVSKIVNANISANAALPSAMISGIKSMKSSLGDNSVNITIGDVHVTEVDNAAQIAKAITNQLPSALLQELNKR